MRLHDPLLCTLFTVYRRPVGRGGVKGHKNCEQKLLCDQKLCEQTGIS